MAARQQLAILGSGWGAFQLLKQVDPNKFAVTLISPRNHMLFTPYLSAASVGKVGPRHICEPLKPVCTDKGARYCEAHAEGIDAERRVVQCRSLQGEAYVVPYDRLVVAVGKRANDFGIPGVKNHALFMKETKDATRLREALLSRLEEAAGLCSNAPLGDPGCSIVASKDTCHLSEEAEQQVRQLLSIIVVGGGPQSVSLAAELTDLISRDVPRFYPALAPLMAVHLVEWASSNPKHSGGLREYTRLRLSRKPKVQMHLGEMVEEASESELRLKSGKALPCGLLVWNAGTEPVPFVRDLCLSKTVDGKRLLTDARLRVRGQQDIFAIGDCAQVEGSRLPQNAQVAVQQADYVAQALNSEAALAGGELPPFQLRGLTGLAYSGALALEGFGGVGVSLLPKPVAVRLAWLAWRSASWSPQLSMKNRLSAASDRLLTLAYGRSLTRFGQDSTELPAAELPAASRPQTAAPAQAWQNIDEHLSSLLGDLGMRPIEQLSRMPPILGHGGLPRKEHS